MKHKLKYKQSNFWRWRWVQFSNNPTLHRISARTGRKSKKYIQAYEDGYSICGRRGFVSMPGIFSRMDAPRCKQCCQIMGIENGNGNPYNNGIAESEADVKMLIESE